MGDLLAVSSCTGMIRALDKNTGQVKWEYDIRKDGEQSQFHGDPLVTDKLLVIASDGKIGHVYAFDRATANRNEHARDECRNDSRPGTLGQSRPAMTNLATIDGEVQ